jgi:hypothetical protein
VQEIKFRNSKKAVYLYVFLGGLFIAFLVVCNLIANKFVSVQTFLRKDPFILSAGILPYPVTFLITDLLSEFYGRKQTGVVIFTGFIASILIIGILNLGSIFPSIEESPVNNETYAIVFGNSWRVIGASMTAYIIAQMVDVKLYDFWKKVTHGKMLWLRNNGSTIFSQLVDTILVVLVLFVGVKSSTQIISIIMDGWLFKVICALIDTPIIYVSVFLIRRYFKLKPGEEINF